MGKEEITEARKEKEGERQNETKGGTNLDESILSRRMSSCRTVHKHTVHLRRSILELGPLQTVEDLSNGLLEVESAEVNSFDFAFRDKSVDHRDGEVDSVGFDEVVVVLNEIENQAKAFDVSSGTSEEEEVDDSRRDSP